MIRIAGVCAALLLLAAQSVASAQPQAADAIAMIERADRNDDGAVTEAELRLFRRTAFDRMDVNRDRRLSRLDEIKWAIVMGGAAARAQLEQFQATLDADQSGDISRTEFVEGRAPVFDLLDANRDRTVDATEFAAARAALAAAARP